MAKIRKSFRCEILTPQGQSISAEAFSAVFPASDGMVGVLGGRAPLAVKIGAGALTVEEIEGGRLEFFIAGGFARMNEDVLTVLAEECTPLGQLEAEEVWRQIEQAEAMPVETPEQTARRDEALDVARLRFRLVQQRKEKRDKLRLQETEQ